MTTLRESKGGGFRDTRGRLFIRVTVAPQQRRAELTPWASSLGDAIARGQVVQAWVNRLRRAGQSDFVEKVVELGAKADQNTLAQLGDKVDAIAGNDFDRVEPAPAAKGGPLTFRRFAEQWTSGELHRLYPDHVPDLTTADDNEMRLGKWVYPVVKDLLLADFTIEHAQEIMRRIPRDKSASTRRHVAQLLVRVLNLAVYPCRHLKASPLPRGFLPKVGPGKALAYLYPDEDAKLMACTAVDADTGAPKVPLVHRLLYGFLAREGMRSDEAQSLEWRDLDLERGTVRLDDNKTDDPRGWTLDPGVAAALAIWRDMLPHHEGTDPVFPGLVKPYALAEMLREHLHAAGVDRPELFESSKTRRQIRVHDLRATFVTLSLATGRTETWVADRTGHKSSTMINRYRRAARTVEELALGWLAPLDEVIPEFAAANTAANAAATRPTPRRRSTATPRRRFGSGVGIRTPISGTKIRGPAQESEVDREIPPGYDDEVTPSETDCDDVLPRPAAASSRVADLEAAIANVTRLLAASDDDGAAAALVAERAAMRAELDEARKAEALATGKVTPIGASPRRRGA